MKSLFTALLLLTAITASAEDLPLLTAPDFKSPLDATWKIVHGTYEPKDGLLICAEKAENKHVAVLWHQVGWQSGIIECEFRFDGSKSLILGCDGTPPQKNLSHTGRVVITPTQISIAEDSVKPSHTLAKQPVQLAPGTWHRLRLTWTADAINLTVNDTTLNASAPFLSTPKTRSWIAVGGQTLALRQLKISGKP